MNRIEQIRYLNNILLQEMPAYKNEAEHFPENEREQRRLLRSLMNVRPPDAIEAGVSGDTGCASGCRAGRKGSR